jgi:UDP-N-acetylmuramate: L-alanyl-gamma-D-glutamyl-meso-diaminopimelate ligase
LPENFDPVKVHLIAIGGSAMHNLAIALHRKGVLVTGSDDEIFEPSRSRLGACGLLPAEIGWHRERIAPDLDAVIVGMHARKDNPELARAQELGLRIYSYPEYLYEQTKEKTRVVIGGSHGKTSITAMILHVAERAGVGTDYMVGAQLEGFDCMVHLSGEAKFAVLEGDEYLSSPTDLRPKFHLYHPDIALISGIAWDHINVFPTFENYVDQFRIFIGKISPGGTLIYCSADEEVRRLAEQERPDLTRVPYDVHPHVIRDGVTWLSTAGREIPLRIFGRHNLQNLSGALEVCRAMGISEEVFYDAIRDFGGAARRLELVKENPVAAVYKDFAHSPVEAQGHHRRAARAIPGPNTGWPAWNSIRSAA